jgi:hypothetical protein
VSNIDQWVPSSEVISSENPDSLFFTRQINGVGVQVLDILGAAESTANTLTSQEDLITHLLLDGFYQSGTMGYGQINPPYCNNYPINSNLPVGQSCNGDATVTNNDALADIPTR